MDIKAYFQGREIPKEGVVVDATHPIEIEVRGYGQNKVYSIETLRYTDVPSDQGQVLPKSTDMHKMGIDPYIANYSVGVLGDQFYLFGTGVSGEVAEYKVYTSHNGVKWSEVSYAPESIQAIGGVGTRCVTFRERLYLLGGARTQAKDRWGNPPETMWGSFPTIEFWRSVSTSDGSTYRVDTVGVDAPFVNSWGTLSNANLPTPCVIPNVVVFGDNMYMKNSHGIIYGQAQGSRDYRVTKDGTNWLKLQADPKATQRLLDVFFVLKGKMFTVGGFNNFISEENILGDIYSSEDGVKWTKEAEEGGFGKMWGMTVISNGSVAYMVGGEYLKDGQRVLSDKIYRTEDGIRWKPINTGDRYKAGSLPQLVIRGEVVYIFGGYGEPGTAPYGFDLNQAQLFDTYSFELK